MSACVRPFRALLLAAACCAPLAAAPQQPPPVASSQPGAQAPHPLPRDLPLRRDPVTDTEGPPWLALVVLLGLVGGAGLFVLRRRGVPGLTQAWQRGRAAPGIERLGSQPLTPQASVHAVRWKGEELLLGCTGTQVTVLARRPAAVEEGQAS